MQMYIEGMCATEVEGRFLKRCSGHLDIDRDGSCPWAVAAAFGAGGRAFDSLSGCPPVGGALAEWVPQ
jgi:hypothetical protein